MCPYCLAEKFRLLADDLARCELCGCLFDLNEDEELSDEDHTPFLKLKHKKKKKQEDEEEIDE